MTVIKPWYKIVTPREDLREGKPLDASEFAVHLDQVRDDRAAEVYQNPEKFFERTYLTTNLTGLAAEVVRRLSSEQTETSAVFNLATQFGGGKTHALTLLYHLAKNGSKADNWNGVSKILSKSGMKTVPNAAVAVFVGMEFDSIQGRGGVNGEPVRKTPWGEIAFQLGGEEGFKLMEEHEKKMIAPAGDVIRRLLPNDKPCLILMDELMNYVSRYRKSGLAGQLYNFLQSLSETVRGEKNVVLAVSIPASELEMTAEDQADYSRFKKLLDRVGKAVVMSAETETSEIIRRRLFEWFGLPEDGRKAAAEFAEWIVDHRQQVPSWFPVDNAREAFEASYPFHPMVLSVFERKWQLLPRFQQTRGVLRLLALWVSRAYQAGFKGAHRDPLIGLGTAPLDDSMFRAAMFEQLGEHRLEGAVTTDICGKKEAHTVRLDAEAVEAIKKARLHQKVATTIFFESNGGMTKATEATLPEIRLAVAEPDLDIGNVETVLESLSSSCYYLLVEKNRYKFGFQPNLNKLLADRRASIQPPKIDERVKGEIQKVFKSEKGVDLVFFPEKSNQISDRPALTLAVLSAEHSMQDRSVLNLVETIIRENGTSARTFKSALFFAIPEDEEPLREEARNLLAWEEIQDEEGDLRLEETQRRQLVENQKKAERDLRECVWKTYKNIALLDKENKVRVVDLGLIHSSAANTLVSLIVDRFRKDGDIEEGISPNFLTRNWRPACKEWSTKSVRDEFYASPQFPRLLNSEVIKDTIVRGVENGIIAYIGKRSDGSYEPFIFSSRLNVQEVEISDDMFIVTKDTAEAYKKSQAQPPVVQPPTVTVQQPVSPTPPTTPVPPVVNPPSSNVRKLAWSGNVPTQKWMNFYTKFVTKFGSGQDIKLTLNFEVSANADIPPQKIEEAKIALRELGLEDNVRLE